MTKIDIEKVDGVNAGRADTEETEDSITVAEDLSIKNNLRRLTAMEETMTARGVTTWLCFSLIVTFLFLSLLSNRIPVDFGPSHFLFHLCFCLPAS